MTKFESDIKKISASKESIYNVLTDLRNLENISDQLPADKVSVTKFEKERIFLKVDLAGEVILNIMEKEPCSMIKFGADKSPVPFNLWIQIVEKAENDCRLKLTIKADLPAMYKMMVSKPIKKFLDMLAEGIANYKYE